MNIPGHRGKRTVNRVAEARRNYHALQLRRMEKAAPEMLSVLTLTEDYLEGGSALDPSQLLAKVKAAIAKSGAIFALALALSSCAGLMPDYECRPGDYPSSNCVYSGAFK